MRASRVPKFVAVVLEDSGDVLCHAAPVDGGGVVFGHEPWLESETVIALQWVVFKWLLFGELHNPPAGFRFVRQGEALPDLSAPEGAFSH